MAESEKFRSTERLRQSLQESRGFWDRVGAYVSYYVEVVLGGPGRGYNQQAQYYEALRKDRPLTEIEEQRYQELLKKSRDENKNSGFGSPM